MRGSLFTIVLIFLITGCSTIGKIENAPVEHLPDGEKRYGFDNDSSNYPLGDVILLLAFSGGGTRAAAFSYGVLEELRDTQYQQNNHSTRLLDEVDQISSVSGGSFTSAYYGLFGDQLFDDFKEVFLYKDVQGDLTGMVFGFFDSIYRLFSTTSRTELAINYYDKYIFRGKTFADIEKTDGPLILINATDLNSESQFTFFQLDFDFLCSDLSEFKIARAVAASSAVPLLFEPVLLKRHDTCAYTRPVWLNKAEEQAKNNVDLRLQTTVDALDFYLDKDKPPYVTLVDGGITDNLGLRPILQIMKLSGGAQKRYQRLDLKQQTPKHLVVIVVNAATTRDTDIGKSDRLPSISDTLSAVTDIQIHRYNTETSLLVRDKLKLWGKSISTSENPVTSYFIELNVREIDDPENRFFINQLPTSFTLEVEQVDRLIESSKLLLRQNPEYQKLLRQLGVAH